MGHVVYRPTPPEKMHKHDYPYVTWVNDNIYPIDTIWECECKQQFQLIIAPRRRGKIRRRAAWKSLTVKVIEDGVYTPQQIRDIKGM